MKNRIAELRKHFGLNQTQLAKKLNTTQANISSWELGKWQPDNEALIKLSIFFHCTIDYLLCKTDINDQQKQPEIIELESKEKLTDEQTWCIETLKTMPHEEVDKIYYFMLGLTGQSLDSLKRD